MKNKIKILEVSLLLGFIISCAFSITSFANSCDEIRNSVLRMHVVANSDSQEDQELKLKVRDAVLEAGKDFFDGEITAHQAQEKLLPVKEELEEAAKKVVSECGFDYDVKVIIGNEFFPTRTYENSITLPAGEYEAVNVIIGEGKGHNWWCVMFPPMCLPAAEGSVDIDDVLTDDQLEIVKSNPKFEPRFKIIEIYEKFLKK